MLTSEAKTLLGKTVRELRERLLTDLHDAAEATYRLSVPLKDAGLSEARRIQRARLEQFFDAQAQASSAKGTKALELARAEARLRAEKEAAFTFLNRVVLLRGLEALGLSRPAVVTGGLSSAGYREFRDFAPALMSDDSEGHRLLLQLVFDELALELPGLFGDVGTTALFPIPTPTLREVLDRLDDPRLASAWTDDTTLGWVYQYWNDPEREALDAKIAGGGKIGPTEIASKTQMFTERYMVEWLLHNSLGLMWLSMCAKNGWRAEAEDVLPVLDARRAAWRAQRERGEVPLDALMPVAEGLEDRWKYFVPQPIPAPTARTRSSLRELRLLDPACGSGHFLVIAFELLAGLYEEEARHRGESWSRRQIAEWILEDNLAGVDIDARAIQIAAAALYLKARAYAPDARPARVNLVAPALRLGALGAADPALVTLRAELLDEAGIPEALTTQLVAALAGVDHLGTLLKVDRAIDDALGAVDLEFDQKRGQGDLFGGYAAEQVKLPLAQAKATVLDKLEAFLGRHAGAEDLGLRLGGAQLAAGVRFVRLVREGAYDLVVGNPPYQGTSKMADAKYVAAHYPRGKADLYAAFLERSLELVREGGLSALVTMRGWMFLGQFAALREALLGENDLRALGDVGWGAFAEMTDNPVVMSVVARTPPSASAIAVCPTSPLGRVRTDAHYFQTIAGLRSQVGRYEFGVRGFEVIEGRPVVYWWGEDFLARYAAAPRLGSLSPARFGVITSDNTRFIRRFWELRSRDSIHRATVTPTRRRWAPFVLGIPDAWLDPCDEACLWRDNALELKTYNQLLYGSYSRKIQNEAVYFRQGIAFSMIGSSFRARVHRVPSIIGNKGSSVFPEDIAATACQMNTTTSRFILESLNPGIGFEVGDVNRLPIFPVESADEIFATIERAFTEHESHREASVEFRAPGPSAWTYAQAWAQRAVDRPAGEPLPAYEPTHEPEPPVAHVSYALGVALGRFHATGEGIASEAPRTALPRGLLFLSTASGRDSLDHPAAAPLVAAWATHGPAVAPETTLRDYLRKDFFAHHRATYDNRPIYFPLSSAKRAFVAWVSIHRWSPSTLHDLLAEHLHPERRTLEGELDDLKTVRLGADKKAAASAERRYADVNKLLGELTAFIADVTELAERGPRPTDAACPPRLADARFELDLDDGVMVNSAALWPLLEPQWKDPKKWWKELATATGRKDYDWSHLAARYYPARVAAKCVTDPSLAVAHRCFWRLHPEKAFAWELRLQDELRPDFTLDEPDADAHRTRFLADHPDRANELRAAEQARRARKAKKADAAEELALEEGEETEAEE
jgi:hypothetical protein